MRSCFLCAEKDSRSDTKNKMSAFNCYAISPSVLHASVYHLLFPCEIFCHLEDTRQLIPCKLERREGDFVFHDLRV